MIKRFLLFTIPVIVLSVILFFAHQFILDRLAKASAIPLAGMYLFHICAYLLICFSVELLNSKLPSQVGYAYLASVFIKVGVFVLVFQDTIFTAGEMSMPSKLSIVIPMFIFLSLEATYCGRLMNAQ